LRSGWIER